MTFSKCLISNRSSNFFAERQPPIFAVFVLGPEVRYENEQLSVDLKIEQPEKQTSGKMTFHGSLSDLPADIVSVDRGLIRLHSFHVGLRSLMHLGLSEPEFYGDLVYTLMRIVGSNHFSAQFIEIISHYKRIGYNINIL